MGLGFRVWGLGFRVSGLGFRVSGFGFRVRSLEVNELEALAGVQAASMSQLLVLGFGWRPLA